MNNVIATLGASLLFAMAARAEERCSKDSGCGPDRTCVQRQCSDPAAPAPAAGYAGLPPPVPSGTGAPAADRPSMAPADHPATTPAPAARLGALAPTATSARTDSPDATRHRHLGGFIRPDLGFGYLVTAASQGGVDATMSGGAGTFGFAMGGALWENNILAFRFWDVVVNGPAYTVGGTSGTASGTLALVGFGPEYSVYSDDNYYVSFSPSVTRMSTVSGSSSTQTNWGIGGRAALGKEWWVSDHWGLGVAGHLSMSLNEDTGSNPPTWASFAVTLAFSATYN